MKQQSIVDSRPISIYNTEKKELIGVFDSVRLLNKYLFDGNGRPENTRQRIRSALATKNKLSGTILGFPVAVRYANSEQIELMNSTGFYVVGKYPQPVMAKMKVWDSTRIEMAEEHTGQKEKRQS